MACFSGNDAVVKTVAREVALGEVLFARGVMACLLLGGLLLALGHLGALRFARNPVVLARSGIEAFAALTFTAALVHMPLASLSSVVMLSPLIITALSVLLLGEVVRWRRWSAIAVGFLGTLFVIKPTPGAFDAWALLGVACAFASASRDLLTRRLPRGIPSVMVTFMAAVSVTLAGLALGLWEEWRLLTLRELGLLALGAAFLACGTFLVVLALREGEISAMAPFRYSLLFWACIVGYLVFGEIPDRWSAFGGALIVGSGIYALHRERVRARDIIRQTPPGP